MRFNYYALMAAAIIACPVAANAAVVQFTFTQTVGTNDDGVPGINIGDTVSLTFFADNGANSLTSQIWTYDHLVSGYLSIGSPVETYFQSYTSDWFSDGTTYVGTTTAFQTDGSGSLLLNNFVGTLFSPNHQDTFGTGGSIRLAQDGFNVFGGSEILFVTGFGPGLDESLDGYEVGFAPSTPVPLPAAAWLLLSGLAGLGFVGRRRTAR